MYETIDDLTAPWRQDGELARRMLALADEMEIDPALPNPMYAATLVRQVVKCEYDPTRGTRLDFTPLEVPSLRPAVPAKAEAGS